MGEIILGAYLTIVVILFIGASMLSDKLAKENEINQSFKYTLVTMITILSLASIWPISLFVTRKNNG